MNEQKSESSSERRTRGDASVLTSIAPKAFEILPTLLQRKKRSAVLRALEPERERIITLYRDGFKAGTIARAFTEADKECATVSTETIRMAILEIIGKPKPRKRSSKATKASGQKNALTSETQGQDATKTLTSSPPRDVPTAPPSIPPSATTQFDPTAQYKRKAKTAEEQW